MSYDLKKGICVYVVGVQRDKGKNGLVFGKNGLSVQNREKWVGLDNNRHVARENWVVAWQPATSAHVVPIRNRRPATSAHVVPVRNTSPVPRVHQCQPSDLAYTFRVVCAELRVHVQVPQCVPGCDGVVRGFLWCPAAVTLTCWRAAECRQRTRQ